jgi:hypothetical protein
MLRSSAVGHVFNSEKPNSDVLGKLWLLAIIASLLSLPTANPVLAVACLLTLPVLYHLVWRPDGPPVMFVGLGFQWLQVSLDVFYANFSGRNIEESYAYTEVGKAIWLSLVGLVVIAAAIHLVMRRVPLKEQTDLTYEAKQYSIPSLFHLYLIFAAVVTLIFPILYGIAPPLRTVFLGLSGLKWVTYFMLAYVVLVRKEHYGLFVVATLIEIVIGFSGFFSDFRVVFIVLFLAIMTTGTQLKTFQWVQAIMVVGMLIVLSIFWSAVKTEHRAFIAGGETTQAVTISQEEKFNDLLDRAANMDWQMFSDGTDRLVNRIAYIKFFSEVTYRVPRHLEYENGAIWGNALRHILMPRILFPDKPQLNLEISLVRKYSTALKPHTTRGTSVSLGYMAESYIDFGSVLMFLPIAILGLMWGGGYRYFLTRSGNRLLVYGFIASYAEPLMRYGAHSGKIVGGALSSFIIMALCLKFGGSLISRYIKK